MNSKNVLTAALVLAAIVLAGLAGRYLSSGKENIVHRTYAGKIDEGDVTISEVIRESSGPSIGVSHIVSVKVTIQRADQSVVVGVYDDYYDNWESVEQCFKEDMPKCYSYTLHHSGGRIFRDWSDSRDGVTARGDYLANEALLDKAVREVLVHSKRTGIN